MEEKKYLNIVNKVGYGIGDFAANMVYALISSFVMIYLTNTAGMNAGIIGTLILISKLLDGFTDIIFGSFIDRTNSKMGKARPWMLWSYVGNAITLILVFMIPNGGGDFFRYGYFFVTYTLLNAVFYTANNISYSALTSLITKNPNERVEMGTFRFIGSTLGNLFVSNMTLVIVEKFGGGAAGWRMAAIIFAVIGLIVNTLSVLSVKELPAKELGAPTTNNQEKIGLINTLKILLQNRYFNMLTILYVLFYLMLGVSMGSAIYYFMYVCGDANWFGKLITASTIPMILGLVLVPVLVKKYKSIRNVNLVLFILNLIVRIAYIFLAIKGNPIMVVAGYMVVALTSSSLGGTYNALVSEASDYTFFKTGKRLDGSMYSCTSFGMKVGGGLGSAISGWLLAASGFNPASMIQTSSVNNMLVFAFAGLPAILTLVVVFLYYKLDVEKANADIRERIVARV